MSATSPQSETQKIPKLRFSGFSGGWEEKKLGEVCKIKTGDKDTQDRDDKGKYPFFVRSNTVERINSFSFDGEAILTSGDGVGVGKNFHYIVGKFDYHQRVYSLNSFKEGYSGKFIYHIFSTKFYKRVKGLSAKNSVDSVRMDMIADMKMYFPSLSEQQKIAGVLGTVDGWVENLRGQKESFESYKKGMMQKIFPAKGGQVSEIRFKDGKGKSFPDWQEKEFLDVFKTVATKNHQVKNSDILVSGKYKVVDQSVDLVAGYSNDERKIFNDVPIIVFGDHTTILKYIDFDFVVGADGTKILDAKNDDNLKFLYYSLQVYPVNTEGYKRHYSVLKDRKINLPSLPEQQKIADFLTSLDKVIESKQQQIADAEQWKKGLMQGLFV